MKNILFFVLFLLAVCSMRAQTPLDKPSLKQVTQISPY